jgi:hypothetical protein
MLRREALGALAGAGLLGLLPRPALGVETGRAARKTICAIEPADDGVTFTLSADNAPFPCNGGAYSDATVLVFVPTHYRLPASRKVDVVVHFHGHLTTAARAIGGHKLREQLRRSRQNAVLVVPQGPTLAADGDFGKLMRKGGLARLLDELVSILRGARASNALGDASLALAEEAGRVIASAHSGGYKAAAAVARRGGVDVREIYLFDALYGELQTFSDHVSSAGGRKLISYSVGGKPRANSAKLAGMLEGLGVEVLRETHDRHLTRQQMVRGRALFLWGKGSHGGATFEERALRDCLLASCLVGRGSASWHADKTAAR